MNAIRILRTTLVIGALLLGTAAWSQPGPPAPKAGEFRCLYDNYLGGIPALSFVCSEADLVEWLDLRSLQLTHLSPEPARLPDGSLQDGIYETPGGDEVVLARYIGTQFVPPPPRSSAQVREAYLSSMGVTAADVDAGAFAIGEASCDGVDYALVGSTTTALSGPIAVYKYCFTDPAGRYRGRSVLYIEGHGGSFMFPDDSMVRWLAGQGFEVYGADLPLTGTNAFAFPRMVDTHWEYATFERDLLSPLWSEFVGPFSRIVSGIRALSGGPVGILGRSGGGMSGYSVALANPAVDYVVSIAGGTPHSMRLASPYGPFDLGDWEQWSPRTYSVIDHGELMRNAGALGGFFTYSGQDPCCFHVMPGDGFYEWMNAPTGDGRIVELVVDPGHAEHAISPALLPALVGFLDRIHGIADLAVTPTGSGAGTVSSDPAGIVCGAICSNGFPAGTVVTLAAAPLPGSTFAGWSGEGCSGTGPCTITLAAAASVTAAFERLVHPVSVAVGGTGAGTVTSTPGGIDCGAACSATFADGSVVELHATPAAGSVFTGWTGACAGDGACVLTVGSPTSVGASFDIGRLTLDVARIGGGRGTVTSTPAGVDCGDHCGATFDWGTVVTLVAVSEPGSTFAGWSGACSGTGSCNVTLVAARSVQATFTGPASKGLIAFDVEALDFGPQAMGTASPARVVNLVNMGEGPLTVSRVEASDAQFVIAHACAVTLAPGQRCEVRVRFRPAIRPGALLSAAPVSATIAAAGEADGGESHAALHGVAEKSLVSHYYQSILRRAPDSDGKVFWERELVDIAALGVNIDEIWFAMAASFYFSSEYTAFRRDDAGFVTDLYNTFFGREPDPAGLAFWADQLAQGLPREVALTTFMFSEEFDAFVVGLFGRTDVAPEVDLVMDFYRGVLSRLPDAQGFSYWLGLWRAAQCGGEGALYKHVEWMSRQLILGPEYSARGRSDAQFVGDLYNAFLRRGGDLAGVAYWVRGLESGVLTREGVRWQFIVSQEFSARVDALITKACTR